MQTQPHDAHYRIGAITASFMMAVVFVVDGLQFILTFIPFIGIIINTFISIVTLVGFFVWLKILGVHFLENIVRSLPKILSFFGVGVMELIPLISSLPSFTIGMASLIFFVRLDDYARMKHRKRELEKQSAEIIRLDKYLNSQRTSREQNLEQSKQVAT